MTIVLIVGLYLGLRFAFGLFTPFNFWTAGQDIKNGKIQIAEIGEMPLNFEQKQKLANSYGFDFYLFGCNVTTDVINGTEYYNRKMVEHLIEQIFYRKNGSIKKKDTFKYIPKDYYKKPFKNCL